MEKGMPSRTALRVAVHRAVHQKLENSSVLRDPFAAAILGADAGALIAEAAANTRAAPMRFMFAARSRFAEDALAAAVRRGVRQAVVLGAGLDTFALRNPFAGVGLKVFELDHPATQGWKRGLMAEAGLAQPSSLVFAPVDFESEAAADALRRAGFLEGEPAFFYWLGVVMYIRRDAVMDVLRFVAGVPDAEIAFDYTEPLENYPPERRAYVEAMGQRAAEGGEPWVTFFEPHELARDLNALGFNEIEDISSLAARRRYLGGDLSPNGEAGGHLIRARAVPAIGVRPRPPSD